MKCIVPPKDDHVKRGKDQVYPESCFGAGGVRLRHDFGATRERPEMSEKICLPVFRAVL